MTDRLTPGLLPGQIERLALVAEECGEVLQVIGKVLRHGHESSHPNGGPTNRELLETELGDLEASIDILVDQDLNGKHVRRAMQDKLNRVGRYLHHTSLRRDEAARREAESKRAAPETYDKALDMLADAPPPPAPDFAPLLKTLRDLSPDWGSTTDVVELAAEAADAIEALRAERDAARKDAATWALENECLKRRAAGGNDDASK